MPGFLQVCLPRYSLIFLRIHPLNCPFSYLSIFRPVTLVLIAHPSAHSLHKTERSNETAGVETGITIIQKRPPYCIATGVFTAGILSHYRSSSIQFTAGYSGRGD